MLNQAAYEGAFQRLRLVPEASMSASASAEPKDPQEEEEGTTSESTTSESTTSESTTEEETPPKTIHGSGTCSSQPDDEADLTTTE